MFHFGQALYKYLINKCGMKTFNMKFLILKIKIVQVFQNNKDWGEKILINLSVKKIEFLTISGVVESL